MNAVFHLLDALRLFRGKSLQEIQEITFEIGMLGQYGLDINDPQVHPHPAVAAREGLLRAANPHPCRPPRLQQASRACGHE
jgi:hypothetical protein